MLGRRRGGHAVETEIPKLRRFARMLTRNDAEADDLVQETLLRALSKFEGYRGQSSLSTWLCQILVNLHRSKRRQDARRRELLEERGADEDRVAPRQEHAIELGETLAALDDLPEEQREAITLVAIDGVAYSEAAEILGLKLGTLMSRISRGRAAIRAAMEGTARRGRAPAAREQSGDGLRRQVERMS
ncbi:MAG: sigma-70 family RNA polymerase sigma factor [Pseudomonadota bacterium]